MLAEKQAVAFDPLSVAPEDRPTGFGYHLVYAGEKYDEMVWFYRTLLGGRVVAAPDGASLDEVADAGQDLVVIARRPELPKVATMGKPGVLHVAWCYNSLAELMYVYKQARDAGIKPGGLLNTEILMQFYYSDPEGNQVEIAVDGHDTSEETQAFQRAAGGVRTHDLSHWKYDPEKILAMMEAGVSDYDIFNHETYHALAASGRF